MSEITFLIEAQETLIRKIDDAQIILQTNINETTGELKSLVNEITELFEKKLRVIENKYNKQADELELLKTELKTMKLTHTLGLLEKLMFLIVLNRYQSLLTVKYSIMLIFQR